MKKFGIFLVILMPLIVGCVVALPYILTSDVMRLQFAKQISSISGMNVALEGPVNLSIVPQLGMVANSVSLEMPDGSLRTSAGQLVAKLKLSTLFSNKIEITAVSLNEPVIEVTETVASTNAADEKPSANASIGEAGGGSSPTDPVAEAVGYLERVGINVVSIRNGRFISNGLDGSRNEISNINLELSAPDLNSEIGFDLSAESQGQKLSANGSLASLRPILEQRPVKTNLSVKVSPAPHPALADISLTGEIQLVDGAYQIANGVFSTLGQPLNLDASYKPGDRPYAFASLRADKVDLGALQVTEPAGTKETGKIQTASNVETSPPDLSALKSMDADFTIQIGSFVVDAVEAKNVDLGLNLKDGLFNLVLKQVGIAGGAVAGDIEADVNGASPTVKGTVTGDGLTIANLAKLAGQTVPADGNLAMNVGYAFRGLSPETIQNSLNLAGNLTLSNGQVSVPELASMGKGADKISGLNVNASVENFQNPIDIEGGLVWKGDNIKFNGRVNPRDFIQSSGGKLALSVATPKLKAKFDGTLGASGSANGRTDLSVPSVDQLLSWLGQGGDTGLKDFAFAGNIDAKPDSFAFSKSTITLNGTKGSGSGKIALGGKTSINANLAFGELNLEQLTGGPSGSSASGSGSSGGSGGGSTGDTPIDLSALRTIEADIQLSAKKLGYGKLTAGPVKTAVRISGGKARFQLPDTPFYGGNVRADITADGSSNVSAIAIDAVMASVDALPLFRDAGDFERLEGKLNASLKTSGSGNTTKQLSKSLSGNAETRFANGAIRGVDIAKVYNNIASVLAGGFKEDASEKTEFTEMGLSMAIAGGVATTNDVRLIGPLVRMDGGGQVDLGEEKINMRLNPKVVASATGQGGDFDVSGLSIPLIVEGDLASPRVYPDLTGVLKDPQGALSMLSNIGLNVKGLKLDKLGKGFDLEKLAKDKLGLDKLGGENGSGLGNVVETLIKKDGNGGTGQVGALIGNLIAPKDGGNNSGNLVGSLLGNLTNDGNKNTQQPAPEGDGGALGKAATGQIAVPIRNPLKKGGGAVAQQPVPVAPEKPAPQKTVQETAVDAVADQLKIPADEGTRKSLNNLLNNVLGN